MTLEGRGWKIVTPAVLVIFPVTVSKFQERSAFSPFNIPSLQAEVLGRCLIAVSPSQFTWARNPNWSRFYSSSEEIWQYFKDVSTKYDLERYVKLNTEVESATWDEEEGKWKLSIVGADGSHFEDSCEILVNGSGVLK